jgi:ligand-binding sensor domain-containing protein/signal transduction histidine kinase
MPQDRVNSVHPLPRSRYRVLPVLAVCGALLLGCPEFAHTLDPSTALTSYARQTWVMENGLPQNTVTSLLQTQDGFLWLGTEAGLVRFDGNNFQIYDRNTDAAMPGNDICCLLEGSDGSLWVGTSEGLTRRQQGKFRAYSTRDGLPSNGIRALARTNDGQFWVYTDQGPARLSGDKFAASNWDSANTAATTVTSGGAFWTGTPQDSSAKASVWRRIEEQAGLQQDAIEFEAVLGQDQRVFASRNLLVVMHGDHVVQQLRTGKELPGGRIQVLLADRRGSLWIGTSAGLARVAGGKLQVFPTADSFGNESVLALLEDREGNVWVGTEAGGLHILRDQRFKTIGTREGLNSDVVTAIVQDRAGTLWIGTQGSGLNAMPNAGNSADKIRTLTARNGLMSDVILALAAAPNGDVWVGTPDGLNRIRGNRVDAFTSADGLPDDFIRSLLVDTDESLWIGTRRGLVHWTGANDLRSQAGMSILTQANGLGSNTVGAMARDGKGDLWVATFAGLSRLHNGQITSFTTANGLSSNVLTALLPRSDGTMLIGTQDHGLNHWDGAKFTAITGGGLDQVTIHGILDDHNGHLWFATDSGIARCDCSTAAVGDGKQGLSRWVEFGTADGLRSRETAANSHPSVARSKDGHLWFATPKGVVEVDPAHFPVNNVPPPVVVERFSVDDVDQPMAGSDAGPRVAAGHVHFQFDYAGLSFTAPLKVRYRYRLEGFDKAWTEAGVRRTAFYTNIPPGNYTFRVQAANNDGVWNTTGASFSFELRPHFYQTIWFYLLLLTAMAAGVFLLLKRRLRLAEREFQAVLGERSRIAREIHDTLAQGYVGISVQLEMLSELLRQQKVDAAAKQLDVTRGYVREGLADARQSIWALRTPDSGETTLPVKIGRLAEAAGGNGIVAQFNVFGAYRALDVEKEREVLRIAQEAIHNVKKHSGARELSVHLRYDSAKIELEVRDDGKGGAQERKSSALHGGFGMTGMRERAATIGGRLDVTSIEDEGTTVRLTVPAASETGEPR